MKDILIRLQLVLLLVFAIQLLPAQTPMVRAKHLTYEVIYDYGHMAPAAVLWELKASDFAGKQLTKPKHFKMDYLLPKPRVKNSAFSFSGYQRGHLCPSGDRDSRRDWFKDTFYTSNIVLMTSVVNSGAWKETEVTCRLLANDGHVLRIIAGPIWYQSPAARITTSKQPAADAMYKVATCTVHPNEGWAWIVPNDYKPRSGADCLQELESVLTVTPSQITNYLRAWIRR